MIAVESAHNIHPKRRPLQPKNIIISEPPYRPKPIKTNPTKIGVDKTNIPIEQPLDACLADELNAVKKKLERLRLDKENTERLLLDRLHLLDNQMSVILIRGQFQKELEIGVDRLFRLKELHLASMRTSSIRSLREREMEKKNKETQSEGAKTGESKEGSSGKNSSIESISSSSEKTSSSSTSTWTSSSRKLPIIPYIK